MNPYVFREYDIRGIVEKDFPEEFVFRLGRAIGTYYRAHGADAVSVGADVRLSSLRLKQNLTDGLLATGIQVHDIGVVPTPVQYFSMHHLPVRAGIQITGSHNPPEYNGFKLTMHGLPVFAEAIQEIRRIMEQDNFSEGRGVRTDSPVLGLYRDYLKNQFQFPRPVKVVIDSGNGAGALVAHHLFRELGLQTVDLFDQPDGSFPNHHPDPTVPANLRDLIGMVRQEKADFGVAFDGDADRIGVVDETGNIIWGDQLLILFGRDILAKKPGATILFEVKCSQSLSEMIEQAGGQPVMWKTGHSHLKMKMKELQAPLAGEMSGHLFFADRYYGFDDAIYAALRLAELIAAQTKPLSALLADVPKYYSTPEIRAEVQNDQEKFRIAGLAKEYFSRHYQVIDVDGVRILFGDGWALVRASNTQPVLVLRFEASSERKLEQIKSLVLDKLAEFGEFSLS